MKCSQCGKEIFTSSSNGYNMCSECINKYNNYNIHIPNNCDIPMPHGFGQQGWICPKCGRGISPFVDVCPCSSDLQITYSTTTDMFNHAWETIKTNLECKD